MESQSGARVRTFRQARGTGIRVTASQGGVAQTQASSTFIPDRDSSPGVKRSL